MEPNNIIIAKVGVPFKLTANLEYYLIGADKSKIIWKKRVFSTSAEANQSYFQFAWSQNNDGEQVGKGKTVEHVFKQEDENVLN